jgi:hypothetical protein
MALTINEFWKLAVESQLISREEAAKLAQTFATSHQGVTAVEELARFLVGTKLTPYQAKILLAGRPGPFVYGDYVIYERIETGRLAGIFRALHRSTGHRVCLMFLSGTATQDAEVMARLTQKVSGVGRASVGHPHLMRCYQLIDNGAFKFIVLEDIEGKRVERQLSTGGPMKVSEACRIVRQAALGLSRMHSMGQFHDAIRPAHVWLEPNHNVKLLNFPLIGDPTAAPTSLAQQINQAGKIPPEADYVAPELIAGRQAPDARSDIYSLGCTLYHMLAGAPPFAGGDLREKLRRHVQEEARPLHEANPQVPPQLSKAVQYMINKDPEMRYQQANSVVEAILPFISAQDAQTKPVPPSAQEQAYEQWLARQAAAPAATAAEEPAAATAASPSQGTPQPVIAQAAPVQAAAVPQAQIATAMPVGGASPYAPQAQQPMMAQPVMAQPVNAVPVLGQPMMAQPMMAQPMMAAPVSPQGFPQAANPFQNAGPGPMFGQSPSMGGEAPLNPAMSRTRRRKSSKAPLIIGVLLLAGGAAALHFSGALQKILDKTKGTGGTAVASQTKPAAGTPANKTAPPAKGATPDKGTVTPGQTPGMGDSAMASNTSTPPNVAGTEADDPREKIYALKDPVWESPTKGAPIDAKYLAPGAQAIIALRAADLAKHPEGEKLFDHAVTGHLGDWFREELPKIAGLPLEKIEQVVISLLDGGAAPPIPAFRIRTTEPVAHEALVAAWGNPAADESAAGKLVFKNDKSSYYLPESGGKRVIVIGPSDVMKDVIETDGAATAMPLELEVMLKQSDMNRTLSVLFVPRVILADGKPVLVGPAKLWRSPLEEFLMAGDGSGDLPKAALASAHLGDALFLEVRVFDSTAGPQNDSGAATIESRLRQLPKQLHAYFLTVPPSKYSLPVVSNFEEMLRQFATLVRAGVGEKQVVARAYLPSLAAHNIAMSAFLATIDNPGSGYAKLVPMGTGDAKPTGPVGSPAEQALAKITSLTFERQPLDKTIELLSDDIGMPIMIDGPSLQIDGITKNQAIAMLGEENKPAKEILKVVLAKANMAGKLCYVIVAKDGAETIYVTTKDGAAKNKWKLPPDYAK